MGIRAVRILGLYIHHPRRALNPRAHLGFCGETIRLVALGCRQLVHAPARCPCKAGKDAGEMKDVLSSGNGNEKSRQFPVVIMIIVETVNITIASNT